MIKFGPISIDWVGKKGLSNDWLLDRTPTAEEEKYLFKYPDLLESGKDTRDILNNIDLASDINQKRTFARFAYGTARPWVYALIFSVFFQGFRLFGFHLEQSEFIAVLSTATGSVLGFAYLIGKYLYAPKANGAEPKISKPRSKHAVIEKNA